MSSLLGRTQLAIIAWYISRDLWNCVHEASFLTKKNAQKGIPKSKYLLMLTYCSLLVYRKQKGAMLEKHWVDLKLHQYWHYSWRGIANATDCKYWASFGSMSLIRSENNWRFWICYVQLGSLVVVVVFDMQGDLARTLCLFQTKSAILN